MALKLGYKQTNVGVIPTDWDVKRLGEVFTISAGKSKSAYIVSGGRYWIIDMGSVSRNGKLIVTKGTNYQGDFLDRSDLVMPKDDIGGGNIIGKVGYIDADDTYVLGDHVYRLKANEGNPLFLSYLINGYRINNELRRKVIGSAQLGLGRKSVEEQEIPFPLSSEQRLIAATLSDVDALLAAIDALIAKKRLIKQGAMQELLTGNNRLPVFRGEWEIKKIGEIFNISVGKSKSKYITEGGQYLIVDMGAISTEGKLIASKETYYAGDFLKTGNLVMPKDDIGGGKIIGKVALIDQDRKYILGDHVYRLENLQGSAVYLSYAINSYQVNNRLRKKVSGSAQLGLGRKSVEEEDLLFPEPKEQQAIAEILSDMDAEISALEQKRAKTRLLKQGMMQELLTGRIRLV